MWIHSGLSLPLLIKSDGGLKVTGKWVGCHVTSETQTFASLFTKPTWKEKEEGESLFRKDVLQRPSLSRVNVPSPSLLLVSILVLFVWFFFHSFLASSAHKTSEHGHLSSSFPPPFDFNHNSVPHCFILAFSLFVQVASHYQKKMFFFLFFPPSSSTSLRHVFLYLQSRGSRSFVSTDWRVLRWK